jgi:radical SAM superfamily enzyme YgiQ (UPF0313 family)
MAYIALINPRYEVSTYGFEYALPFLGAKCFLAVASLPLLAALTPAEHRVTLIDENIEPIDFDRCARADIVGVTGNVAQRTRMKSILGELKRRGAFTVVGGPWISVDEGYFGDLADVVFVGEAEETWPRFLTEWHEHRHLARYEQREKTDMSKVPVPRFDLLKLRKYAYTSIQFSRGCPFTCEFCDIIIVFGRRPRVKTSAQVIAELDALLAQGIDRLYVADDNFVGDRKAIKAILQDVIAWQEAKGYPMAFATEASLDLADDKEMLKLMVAANFVRVFVGIETPNEAALRETKKLQNLRKGGTMLEKVHRIQAAGLEVISGMVIGFDNDDGSIFEAQCRFIREARIVTPLVNLLYAIPKTPLFARLASEGRLDRSDEPAYGTNVIPLTMSREELFAGAMGVMRDLYHPTAYFDRVDALLLDERLAFDQGRMRYLQRHRWQRLKMNGLWLAQALAVFLSLMWRVPDTALRREYRRRMWQVARRRCEPIVLRDYAIKCAMHYHLHVMVWQHQDIGTASPAAKPRKHLEEKVRREESATYDARHHAGSAR